MSTPDNWILFLMADDGFRHAIKEIRNFARDGQQAGRSEQALCLYAYLADDAEFLLCEDTGKRWRLDK